MALVVTSLQTVKQCNEGARKMSNLEHMNKIDKILDFRAVKVSILYSVLYSSQNLNTGNSFHTFKSMH